MSARLITERGTGGTFDSCFTDKESQFEVSIKDSNDQIAQAHKYLGGIYWRNKQYKHAADELERYITLDPKAPDRAKISDTIKDLRSKN